MPTGRVVDLGINGLTDAVEIGRGGFAVVYRASQPSFGRLVAVKVLNAPALDEGTRAAFRRECQAIGRLSGRSHILTVHDAGLTDSGLPYLIMAYLSRGSLEDDVQTTGAFDWRNAVSIGTKVALALEAAHQAGILHRDLKPANILISDEGEPQLADFGIARVVDATYMTRSGFALTPAHSPPEMWEGRPPTPAGDIYSLASTLFALIAGHPPFVEHPDDSLFVVMARVAGAPVPDLRPRGVPDAVCSAIERALAKDPDNRFQTAAGFAAELRDAEMSSATIRPGSDDLGRETPPSVTAAPAPARDDSRQDAIIERNARGSDSLNRDLPLESGGSERLSVAAGADPNTPQPDHGLDDQRGSGLDSPPAGGAADRSARAAALSDFSFTRAIDVIVAVFGLVLVWLSLFVVNWGKTDFQGFAYAHFPTDTSPLTRSYLRPGYVFGMVAVLAGLAMVAGLPSGPRSRLLRSGMIVPFALFAAWHLVVCLDLSAYVSRKGLPAVSAGAYLGSVGYLAVLGAMARAVSRAPAQPTGTSRTRGS